ncbi:hypothetical protein BCR35DRAFT_326628 [Leucosporidium creatinivorum]|uniref:GAR domain-containing protein n=1 Tax=Leucosporidium creatinivorum TaxID=106004 RepID=A0A1Y2DX18_9BASI|nr:hypothetical protein BCR35DRAFT_326628 [Leucosporidium creatinivorum]
MTLAELPQENGAATAPPAASAEGEQVVKLPETKLEGAEVLELTEFARKKAWIDDKIQFLSSLPPVDAVTPDPPTRSPTTAAELEKWWEEHDRISKEVEEYDIGDLARLKTFAKAASKQHLSPRDTDLIEITLTTLFAVDKLLHLLRNRRKALSLLQYRLQWEEQVAAAWQAHRAILADIPTFLSKSRWIPPPPPEPVDFPASTPTTIPRSSSSSSLASTRTHASAMSRTMRSEILSLELARSKSRIHALTSNTIPTTAKSLDKLIDTSPAPLPDSFLDEQDRLEDSAKELTQGLDGFLADMVKQWRFSDELFWKARKVQERAETVERDIEEALLKLPERSLAEAFESREPALRNALSDAQNQLARTGALPTPSHGAAPEQVLENERLLEALRQSLTSAGDALDSSRERLATYRFAIETLERAKALRAEMERSAVAFEHFVAEEAQLAGRPDLNDQRCLSPNPSEIAFDASYTSLSTSLSPFLASAPQLLRDASSVIVDLNKAGIDPNIRRATKETMQRMRDAQAAAQRRIKDEMERKARSEAARALAKELKEAEERVTEARRVIFDTLNASRWIPGARLPSPPPLNRLLDDLRLALDSSLSSPLTHASTILHDPHPPLHSHLQTRASSLRYQFADLSRLRDVALSLHSQSLAATSVLSDVKGVDDSLAEVSSQLTSDLAKSRADWDEGEMDARRAKVEEELETTDSRLHDLIGKAHTRIPFLAPASPPTDFSPPSSSPEPPSLPSCLVNLSDHTPPPEPTPLPLNLWQQDADVRIAVNEATAAASGRLEELRRLLALLEHQQQAFAWDSEHSDFEVRLDTLDKESKELQSRFDDKSDDAEDILSPLLDDVDSTSSRLTPSLDALTTLSDTFAILRAAPPATDDLFRSHLQIRQPSLDNLHARHSSLAESLASLHTAVAQALTARREREAAQAKRRDEEAARLAGWQARLAELDFALTSIGESTATLLSEATEDADRAALCRREVLDGRLELLDLEALSLESDVDLTGLERTRTSATRLRATFITLTADLSTGSSDLASLDAELPTLNDPSSSTTSASTHLLQLSQSFDSIRSTLSRLDAEISAAEVEGGEWAARRASRVQENRAREEEQARRVKDERQRKKHESEGDLRSGDAEEGETALRDAVQEVEMQDRQAEPATVDSPSEPPSRSPAPSSLPSFVLDESEPTPDDTKSKLDSNGLPLRLELPANRLRRSRSSGRPSFTSAEDVDDVFGKKSSNPPFPFDDSTANEPAEVTTLRAQLDGVVVDVWLDSSVVLHLPTVTEVDNLRQDLSVMEDELEAVSTGIGLWADLGSVKEELERKSTVLERVASLARFNDKLSSADASLSNLLNSIDASSADPIPADDDPFAPPPPSNTTPLPDALLAASAAVTAVRKGAISLIDDPRVKAHVERVEEAYGEMMAMVEDLERRPPSSSGSARSLGSLRPALTTPRQQSRTSTRTTSRPTSSASTTSSRRTSTRGDPPSIPPSRPSSTSSRQSTFSLKTPTRRASLATSPTPTPRRRTNSAIPLATPRASLATPRPTSTIPRGFSFGSTSMKLAREDLSRSTSSIPRSASRRESLGSSLSLSTSTGRRDSAPFPRRDSIASSLSSSTSTRRTSQAFNTPSRYSKASLEEQRRKSSTFSPSKVKKAYKANPNRKVDVEVGRIINELEMHVPISAAEGAYNDESGMYWIGEADTGRLYFCRILRSKTVMVRVGGGWQGLLPFIISHFGSADVTISPRVSPSNSSNSLQANDPHWISSGSLSASQSSTSSLANFLSVSTTSSLLSSSSSFGRRTVSGGASPLRRSSRSSFGGLPSNATPKAHKSLPQWKP